MADAAAILTRRWTLVVTNVPFLGYREMANELVSWLIRHHPSAKGDLGYCLWRRFFHCIERGGSIALVTLQHWRSAISYQDFRKELLSERSLDMITYLGTGAFRTITGQKVNITLSICSENRPINDHIMVTCDASEPKDADAKAQLLVRVPLSLLPQLEQLANPAQTILFHRRSVSVALNDYAWCLAGIMNGDTPRFTGQFWEIVRVKPTWTYLQSTVDRRNFNGGRDKMVYYDEENGHLREDEDIRRERLHNSDERGNQVWGKVGVAINQMADLAANHYYGDKFDSNVAVIVAKRPEHTLPVIAFCTSPEFQEEARKIEQKLNITNATFGRIPFDLARWEEAAAVHLPDGLPAPYSDDPTQWLFHGQPRHASPGTELHVAIAHLSGYRWPAETDSNMRLSARARAHITEAATLPPPAADGLLALVPVLGERPLADRLRAFCSIAWDDAWIPNTEAALVAAACDRANEKPPRQLTLDAWLRTHAARQHSKLFHDRPFLWWITDGRADGFTAVAHYHGLTTGNLERLAFAVLGDWITRLGDDPRAEAARVLQAKLGRILEGEAPYDIFVRWKPLAAQPLGWDPDMDDGVRLNIRPFIQAGVLAHEPN